jgi:hypothetical protein
MISISNGTAAPLGTAAMGRLVLISGAAGVTIQAALTLSELYLSGLRLDAPA